MARIAACGGACRGVAGVTPGALLLPLVAGLGYACAAIVLKRALMAGASGGWVNLVCNTVMALFFQLFWLLPGHMPDFGNILAPALCGVVFYLGQVFTFRAIASGDVSVATPLLGVKVLLVAILSVFLFGKPLPASWWLAAFLATLGIVLISHVPGGGVHRRLLLTVGYSLGAAGMFALTDVLVQNNVSLIGFSRFAPLMFATTGLLSLLLLPSLLRSTRSEPTWCPVRARPWLAVGALLLALQALGMYSAIGLYGSATATNILYSSRCIVSVVLVWGLGSLARGVAVGRQGGAVMACRFAGALLLFLAMALVLR